MFNKTQQQLAESVKAVEQYIAYKPWNKNRHKAWVLTSEKEETYPSALDVTVQLSGCYAKVIIEWNGSCGGDYPDHFTTMGSTFQFISGQLLIVSTDRFDRKISISISSKEP
jgi:hypothetical protein